MAAKKQQQREPNPVTVNNVTRRNDDDGLEGHFVDIVGGEHSGRRGVFERVESYAKTDGYPEMISVRSRDSRNELLHVPYKHVRPAKEYYGGR